MQQHVPIHTPPSTKLVLDLNLFRPVQEELPEKSWLHEVFHINSSILKAFTELHLQFWDATRSHTIEYDSYK